MGHCIISLGRRAHLHGCGDIHYALSEQRIQTGSSPRVWRHSPALLPRISRSRFISTGVETLRRDKHSLSLTDGSSPRVWRHSAQVHRLERRIRFISTGVETFWQADSVMRHFAVHLHGCGDIALDASRYASWQVHLHGCGDIAGQRFV